MGGQTRALWIKQLRLIPLIVFLWVVVSCGPSPKQSPPAINELNAEQLAKTHCSRCHQYPQPTLLPRSTWGEYVLPRMGYLMGFFEHDSIRDQLLLESGAAQRLSQANTFPQYPTIDRQHWQKIQEYYLSNAPVGYPRMPEMPVDQIGNLFKAIYPTTMFSPPSTTMVTISDDKRLTVSDAHTRSLMVFNDQLQLENLAKIGEGAVTLLTERNRFLVTVMGSFSPTDAALGKLISLPIDRSKKPKILLKELQRPVHASSADLNNDGLTDLVISEFGKWTGKLSWHRNLGNDSYESKVLKAEAGAIKTVLVDLNQDQHLDVIALFGQAREGIYIFYGDGRGNFEEQLAVELSAAHGSNSFEVIDFNGDGDLDLLLTAGDNADYPPVLKPFHGIYLFLNDGENNFYQDIFIPYHGAYAAKPFDFDRDGDLDIAAISFFPNFADPDHQGFLLFQNQGDDTFTALSFEGIQPGRWLVMDTGDLDHDGDEDIVLGSLAFEVVGRPELTRQWTQSGIPFVLLENQTIAQSVP